MHPAQNVIDQWSGSAPFWEKHRDLIRLMYGPVTEALVEGQPGLWRTFVSLFRRGFWIEERRLDPADWPQLIMSIAQVILHSARRGKQPRCASQLCVSMARFSPRTRSDSYGQSLSPNPAVIRI